MTLRASPTVQCGAGWVNGTPGQVQLQVATGAANVAVYGALGAAEIAPRGSDIVIVGPALNKLNVNLCIGIRHRFPFIFSTRRSYGTN